MSDCDRKDAIEDCLYAKRLGDTALKQHLERWCDPTGLGDYDYTYHLTCVEILAKLNTDECLLKV